MVPIKKEKETVLRGQELVSSF